MNNLTETESQAPYSYVEPIGTLLKGEPLVAEISSSVAFQRLKDVRFLGSIDYWLIPSPNGSKTNVRYTRFQHSLGVARLAMLYADIKAIPEKDRKLIIAAALLHDIGHAPFSHSVESFFEKEFGINHHLATNQIIKGNVEIGIQIPHILKKYKVDIDQVIDILNGKEDKFDSFFSGPINFDTIEGILRSREYIGGKYIYPKPTDILTSAINRTSKEDRNIVDSFWRYKHQIYQFIVRSPSGVLSDHLATEAYRKNISKINKKDFLSTERRMIRRLPDLQEVLFSPRTAVKRILNKAEPISYNVRNFLINPEANFFDWDDKNRYTQSKDAKVLYTYFISAELANKGKRRGAGSIRTSQRIFKY